MKKLEILLETLLFVLLETLLFLLLQKIIQLSVFNSTFILILQLKRNLKNTKNYF